MQAPELESTAVVLGESGLFGIRTGAAGQRASLGLIVLNAGMVPNVGPYRLHPELSIALRDTNVCVLRLDQSGKGESPVRADLSPADAALVDYDEAFAHLAARGVRETVVMGLCSGAVDALRIAAARDSVSGLILLDGYVERTPRWHVERFRRRVRGWLKRLRRMTTVGPAAALRERPNERGTDDGNAHEGFLTDIRNWRLLDLKPGYLDVLTRGVKILSVVSGSFYPYNYAGQLSAFLSVDADSVGLREVLFDDANHTYLVARHRQRLISLIRDWLIETFEV